MPNQSSRRWTYSLWSLLVLVLVVAVPLAVYVNRLHRQRVERMLAQPLIDAADRGDTEQVQLLLDQGANINSVVNGRFPWTPLMHASFHGQEETVKLLLSRGARVDHECLDGFTAITLAAAEGFWPIVRQLAAAGADVDHQDATGQSARSLAEQHAEQDSVEPRRSPVPGHSL